MGSEQSAQQAVQRQGSLPQGSIGGGVRNVRRQHTIAATGIVDDGDCGRPGSISPGPSVCSDSDLPYISYTVNRPIGDSPKLAGKQHQHQHQPTKKGGTVRKSSLAAVRKRSSAAHNIVVVNRPAAAGPNVERDAEVLRLQAIPMFLPIMRGTLNLPAVRDPEVLERLEPQPLSSLCARYQTHLTTCASLVASEQNTLTQRVRETDQEVGRLLAAATDKQIQLARYAKKLSEVQELSRCLNRCHMLLNQALDSMDTLNTCLDIEDRLEPFVWTTG